MSGADVELDVTLNTAAVTQEIARLASDAEAAAGANGKAAASTQNWRKAANSLKEDLEKQAGAIGALTVAFGQQEGTVGKLARGVGGLALAYSSGGPFGVALAATVTIVGELDQHYESVIAKQDEAIRKASEHADASVARLRRLERELATERGQSLPDAQAGSDAMASASALSTVRARMAELEQQAAITEKAISGAMFPDGLREKLQQQQADLNMMRSTMKILEAEEEKRSELAEQRIVNAYNTASQAELDADSRSEAIHKAERERIAATYKDRINADRRYAKERVLLEQSMFGEGAVLEQRIGPDPAALDEMDALIADHDKAIGRIDADKRAVEKAQWDEHYNAIADARFEAHRRAVFQIEAIERDLFENQMPAMASSGASAFQSYLDAKIKGEEDAEVLAAAAFMRSTGQQLVGIGIKALFEGAAINAVTPGLGMPSMAVGAAAIAAGVGMGAGATGIEHVAAGGTIGQALPDAAAKKDRGLNARTSSTSGRGGGSGGAGMTVVNNYGVSGPTAEDQAREMARRQALISRRRFTG